MDKSTLSNYGWIVIAVLVLAVMIALASPFGHFIENGVKSTAQGLFDVNQNALNSAGITTKQYSIIEGANQTISLSEDTTFRSDAEYDKFVSVRVDGNNLDSSNYTVLEGSTVVVLKDYFVATLTNGTHNLMIISKDGKAECVFVVEYPTPQDGDTYQYGDYIYTYKATADSYYHVGWQVDINTAVTDKNQTTYGAILESINGKPVTNMYRTFYNCRSLVTAPVIPCSVTNMFSTFFVCTALTTAPAIPNGVTTMQSTFNGCTSIVTAPTIPSSVTNLQMTFRDCNSLVTTPVIPSSVTNMSGAFIDCTSLTTAPVIPNGVTDIGATFNRCYSLKTYVGSTDPDGDFSNYVIPNSVTDMESTFSGCTSITTAPTIPDSVTIMNSAFSGCSSLTTAPVIPSSVMKMQWLFQGCTTLTGIVEINTNPTSSMECFNDVDFLTQRLTLTGISTRLDVFGNTGINYCKTCNGYCKGGH